jgi:hypothetical protein
MIGADRKTAWNGITASATERGKQLLVPLELSRLDITSAEFLEVGDKHNEPGGKAQSAIILCDPDERISRQVRFHVHNGDEFAWATNSKEPIVSFRR